MRRPYIEAAPMLAAAGQVLIAIPPRRRMPEMTNEVRFALMPRLDPAVRPRIYPDLDALARAVQRRRNLRGLEMVDVELDVAGRAGPTPAVQVWALDAGNDRDELIGYVWLDGRGQDVLREALRRNPAVPSSEAA